MVPARPDATEWDNAPVRGTGPLDLALASLRRFVTIEGTQQAIVLGAQAFTSLIPFTVVAAAFAPGDSDMADRIVDRFGLDGASAESVRQLFASAGETESAITVVSVAILVVSALSFTRSLQRMFQRAYDRPSEGLRNVRRGLAWLACLAVWVTITAPLRETFEDVGGVVFAVTAAAVSGFVVWLGTPVLLLGERNWRSLAPGAAVSGLLGALLSVASSIYVPLLMDWSAERYGLIGVAFALQSWLLAIGFVIVIGAVVGATTVEHVGEVRLRTSRQRVR
jgi:membrane protein